MPIFNAARVSPRDRDPISRRRLTVGLVASGFLATTALLATAPTGGAAPIGEPTHIDTYRNGSYIEGSGS